MLKRVLTTPAMVAYLDEIGRIHPKDTQQTAALAQTFRDFQKQVLEQKIVSSDPLTSAALSMLAFDAIATPHDAVAALAGLSAAYRCADYVYVDWSGPDGRRNRRQLSTMTTGCAAAIIGRVASKAEVQMALTSAAQLVLPVLKDPLATLLQASLAWMMDEGFPGAIIAHVAGLAPFTALPRSALVREQSGLAIKDDDETLQTSSDILGAALDVYFSGGNRSSGSWAVDRLKEACTYNRNVAPHINKRDMLRHCADLAVELPNADPMSALVVAWATDLIESGTERKPNIHPGTIDKYVRIAGLLHLHIDTHAISSWSLEEFQSCYRQIIDESLPANRKSVASALTSWHSFLVRWLDCPPLRARLHKHADEPLPAANAIWRHERDAMSRWVSESNLDERLRQQIEVALECLWHGLFRAKELFHTTLANVREYDDVVEIEVAPLLRDGPTKSKSGRRVLSITDPAARKSISALVARRRAEGAFPTAYLFGDPHDPSRVYRLGSMYAHLNRLIKVATGDRQTSVHTFRHGGISRRVEDALVSSAAADIEPLDEISVAAGHLSGATTIRYYSHRFEGPLRFHLDSALSKNRLTSSCASALSGVSATALRQRAFAKKRPQQDVVWEAIRTRAPSGCFPSVTDGIETHAAESPLTSQAPECVDYERLLLALRDMANGYRKDIVASRNRLDPRHVVSLESALVSSLKQLVPVHMLQMNDEGRWQFISKTLANATLGFDFNRIDQDKFLSVRTNLPQLPDAKRTVFTAAWRKCYRAQYLSLDDPHHAGHLFGGLHACKVPRARLGFSIACEFGEPATDAKALAQEANLQYGYQRSFSGQAAVDYKCLRRGRPLYYLIWSSSNLKLGAAVPSAALSISGFNSLMLAAVVLDVFATESINVQPSP